MNLPCCWLFALALATSLVLGDISPTSNINVSFPCQPESSGISNGMIWIFQQGDIDAISSCDTFHGTINIDPSFPGDALLPNLVFMNGSLNAGASGPSRGGRQPPNLTGLVLPRLVGAITQPASLFGLSLSSLPRLQTLWLPQIGRFTEEFSLDGLPVLTNMSIIGLTADNVSVLIRNTSLSQVHFRIHDAARHRGLESCIIMENDKLLNFTIQGDYAIPFPGGVLRLEDNAKLAAFSVTSNSTSNKIWDSSGSVQIHECPRLEAISLPGVESIEFEEGAYDGSISIEDCASLNSVSSPHLQSVGVLFAIMGCPSLYNVSFPALVNIGGALNITNDSSTNIMVEMPSLQTVAEVVSLDGGFSDIEMPLLTQAYGGFMVNSTNTSSFSCSNFDRLHSLGFIRDPYVCKGSPTNGTTKETTGPSSSLSTGAKAGIGLGIGAAVVLFGTLIWWFCFRKKRQQTEQEDVRPADTIPELPQGRHHEMAEASAISLPGELHARSVGEGFQYAVPRGFGSQTGTESQGDVMRNVARRHELQ